MEYEKTIKVIEQTIQEHCSGYCNQCKYTRVFGDEKCPFIALEYALGIIYRQNAEIEHLKSATNCYRAYEEQQKAEAIKKFVELLKENANNWNELTVEQIEQLAEVEGMVGEQE